MKLYVCDCERVSHVWYAVLQRLRIMCSSLDRRNAYDQWLKPIHRQ